VGETYWVVFELAVHEQHKSSDFGKATVQYFDTFARQKPKVAQPYRQKPNRSKMGSTTWF